MSARRAALVSGSRKVLTVEVRAETYAVLEELARLRAVALKGGSHWQHLGEAIDDLVAQARKAKVIGGA